MCLFHWFSKSLAELCKARWNIRSWRACRILRKMSLQMLHFMTVNRPSRAKAFIRQTVRSGASCAIYLSQSLMQSRRLTDAERGRLRCDEDVGLHGYWDVPLFFSHRLECLCFENGSLMRWQAGLCPTERRPWSHELLLPCGSKGKAALTAAIAINKAAQI